MGGEGDGPQRRAASRRTITAPTAFFAQDEALRLRYLEVGAAFGVAARQGAVALVGGEAAEPDQTLGDVIAAFVRQEVAEQLAAAGGNDAAPGIGVAAQGVALKGVDLVADERVMGVGAMVSGAFGGVAFSTPSKRFLRVWPTLADEARSNATTRSQDAGRPSHLKRPPTLAFLPATRTWASHGLTLLARITNIETFVNMNGIRFNEQLGGSQHPPVHPLRSLDGFVVPRPPAAHRR